MGRTPENPQYYQPRHNDRSGAEPPVFQTDDPSYRELELYLDLRTILVERYRQADADWRRKTSSLDNMSLMITSFCRLHDFDATYTAAQESLAVKNTLATNPSHENTDREPIPLWHLVFQVNFPNELAEVASRRLAGYFTSKQEL